MIDLDRSQNPGRVPVSMLQRLSRALAVAATAIVGGLVMTPITLVLTGAAPLVAGRWAREPAGTGYLLAVVGAGAVLAGIPSAFAFAISWRKALAHPWLGASGLLLLWAIGAVVFGVGLGLFETTPWYGLPAAAAAALAGVGPAWRTKDKVAVRDREPRARSSFGVFMLSGFGAVLSFLAFVVAEEILRHPASLGLVVAEEILRHPASLGLAGASIDVAGFAAGLIVGLPAAMSIRWALRGNGARGPLTLATFGAWAICGAIAAHVERTRDPRALVAGGAPLVLPVVALVARWRPRATRA